MSTESHVLWIEVLSRHGAVATRHRVECPSGAEICIGRGYDNDVVLDDPFVAPRHLRVMRDASGALFAEDLGSANGLFIDQDRRRSERAVVDAKRVLRIGRTRLRIRQPADAVVPERIVHARMRLWPVATALALTVLGGELLAMWLRETTEQQLSDYLALALTISGGVAAWSGGWASISHSLSGRARFQRHLVIALSGLLALWFINEATAYAAFALSRREPVAYRYIAFWAIAAFVSFLHLRQLSLSRETARLRLKLKAISVTLLALIAIGTQTLSQWESNQNSDRQTFVRGLKPPMLGLARPDSEPRFFARVAQLKSELDLARSEPPSRWLDFGGDDDDD